MLIPLSLVLPFLFIDGSLFLEITEGNPITNMDRIKTNDSLIRLFGLEGENLTTEKSIKLGLHNSSGFLVTNILDESPADKAGIRKYDIILELNNTFIKSKSDFESSLKNIHKGGRVNVTIFDPSRHVYNLQVHLVWDNKSHFYQNSNLFKKPESVNFSLFRDLDFTIIYPSSWNTTKISSLSGALATTSVTFSSLYENNTDRSREYVGVYVRPALNQSIEQAVGINRPNNEYQIIERNNVSKVGQYNATSLSFRYFDESHGDVKAIKIATIHNSKIYLITYYAEAENFDFYWPTIRKMIQSFLINDLETYESFNLGLSIKYAKNILKYRYDCTNFDSCVEFRSDDLDKNLKFKVTAFKTLVKDKPMNTLISERMSLKNNTLIHFSLVKNSHNSSITNNEDRALLLYKYYDPNYGYIKGEEILKRVNDKLYSFEYEANEQSFSKNRSLLEAIINSVEFLNISSYYNYDFGISMLYPSTWQIVTVGRDSLKISQADKNEIYFVVNMSMAPMDNKTSPYFLQCSATNDRDDGPEHTALVVRMNAEGKCATVGNIVESIRSIDDDYTSGQDLDKSYKGQIDHPFDIRYNSCWRTEDLNGIFRGIAFYPNDCGLGDEFTSFSISYWNERENGKTLDDSSLDDFTFLNENYKEVDVHKQIEDADITSHIKNNVTSVTYTFKNQYGDQFTSWILYGTDDYKRNYRIEYFSTYDKFLKYWPTVMDMIKSISVLDPIVREELPHGISIGEGPFGAVFDSTRNLLYVVNAESKTISIINSTSNKEIEQVEVSTNPPPIGVAINKATDTLYVTHNDPLIFGNSSLNRGMVTIIKNVSNTKIITSKTIIGNPFEIAVNSQTGKIYIGDMNNDMVTVLNGSHNETSRLKLMEGMELTPSLGFGLAIDESSNTIYAVEEKSGKLTLIDGDTEKITKSINITRNLDENLRNACLVDVAVDQGIDRAYVVDNTNCRYTDAEDRKGRLLVIDTINSKVIDKVAIGTFPNNVVVNPHTHRIYVTNNLNDSITIIEPLFHETTELKVGAGPTDIAVNPKTSIAYITNQPTNSITMVDENTKKIVQSIKFNVFPSKAGVITCNNLDYNANNSYGLILNKGICEARPKAGFSFESWNGNVKDLSVDVPTEGPIILQPFYAILTNLGLSNDPGRLDIRSSGELQANFRSAPEPIPREYWTGLIGIAIAIFTGYLAPNAAQWINSFRQRKCMVKYYAKIEKLPKDDNYLKMLGDYKKNILYEYGNGKINEKQYEILNEQISNFEKQVDEKVE